MGSGMSNITDYLTWRGDISLACMPFNDADNLVLSLLAYILFENIMTKDEKLTVKQAATILNGRPNDFGVMKSDNVRLLSKMADGARFQNAAICHCVSEIDTNEEKQFAAITILLDDGTCFVAYRGTDNTLIGWKEDFNLSFISPVPAQTASVRYLTGVAGQTARPLRIGGHSKGGNLAIYAASQCSQHIQDRVVAVYSNDGPGLDDATFTSDGYMRIRDRFYSFVPQSSIIGMLLQHQENYAVVISHAIGLFQHNPYTWQVNRDGFEIIGAIRPGSRYMDATLKNWLSSVSMDERMIFVDTLFTVLSSTNATTLQGLTMGWWKNAYVMLMKVKDIDSQTRKIIIGVLVELVKAAMGIRSNISPTALLPVEIDPH